MPKFRSIRLLLLLSYFWIAILPLVSYAQDEGSKPDDKRPARSNIRGRVIFADSLQPIRRATIRLLKDFDGDFIERTITTNSGEFLFQAVPAGTYYFDIDVAGVVSPFSARFKNTGLSVEQSSLFPVTVDDATDVTTEIKVPRGAVISGRINYSDGEPATHAQIVLYSQQGGVPKLVFTQRPRMTDDRGYYRIEGLPAGRYFVGAVENHSHGNNSSNNAGGLVTAYHPAASSIRSATVISLDQGREASDVNIKFFDEVHRLTGILKWQDKAFSVKHATVFLRRLDQPASDVQFEQLSRMTIPFNDVDEDDAAVRNMFFLSLLSTNAPFTEADDSGRWAFKEVPEGNYVVSVEAPIPVNEPEPVKTAKKERIDQMLADMFAGMPDFRKGIIRGRTEVKLKDKDVDDITITLSEGGSVAGSVVIDGEIEDEDGAARVVVRANYENMSAMFDMPAQVKKDGTFILQSLLAGKIRIDIFEPRDSHYYIRSLTGNGLDLLKEPLTLVEGEHVTGIRIVLGTDLATVNGRVVTKLDGPPVPGASVAVIPVNQKSWVVKSSVRLASTDAEGRFSLKLAPGEYSVIACPPAEDVNVMLDTYVSEHRESGIRITLKSRETKTVELPVTPKALP